MNAERLLDVRNLEVHFEAGGKGYFGQGGGTIKAVDDVSFSISRGQTLGLIGETGSGKTTVGRAILRALDPTSGEIDFWTNGQSVRVSELSGRSLKRFRRHMQLIFQDPYSSLNPRMTVRDIIAEPLECQNFGTRAEIDQRVRQIAMKCRLNLEHLRRFPHAFSGGQRQRICIARALVASPDFIVCDEPVSSLDVSIQAEVINLLMDLQDEFHLTYLFISHDLSMVAQISTHVAVMYVGRLIELAPTEDIFLRPMHPYTKALLSAIPVVDPERAFDPIKLEGEIPNPLNLPSGCQFHTRCPYVQERCRKEAPAWRELAPNHFANCHFAEELEAV